MTAHDRTSIQRLIRQTIRDQHTATGGPPTSDGLAWAITNALHSGGLLHAPARELHQARVEGIREVAREMARRNVFHVADPTVAPGSTDYFAAWVREYADRLDPKQVAS